MRPTTSGRDGGERTSPTPLGSGASGTRITNKPSQQRHSSLGTGVPRWRSGLQTNTVVPYEEYDLREATRAHGRSFLGMLRLRLGYLIRTRREEGFLYSAFDVMMHMPVALIGMTLFLVIARNLHTVHDGGYAVGALAFAYTLKISTTPIWSVIAVLDSY